MNEQTDVQTSGDVNLEDLVSALDQKHADVLPKRALREAQRRREEITPRLIEIIRIGTEEARSGATVERDGCLFALFLLTEFQAKEALPAILEAVSLPDKAPFMLFGDAVTEHLSRVLAALADSPEVFDSLIANRSLNMYVRWEAAQAYLNFVRDGRLTREEAVQRLREHLGHAVANRDAEAASALVTELVSYAPHEALAEIEEAFRQGLVDEWIVGWKEVKQSIAEGDSRFKFELERCRSTGIVDTVEELSRWVSFRGDNDSIGSSPRLPASSRTADVDDWGDDVESLVLRDPPRTIRNTGPRVGRNDPCPCGSGKKYKKCCGAS